MDMQRNFGGTDIAAILGKSKWKSPLDVWLKCRGLIEPRDPNAPEPDLFVLGRAFEEPIFQIFRDRHPEIADACSPGDEEITGFDGDPFDQIAEDPDDPHAHHKYRLQSHKFPWLGGTPDRFVIINSESEGYEGKTAHPLNINEWGPSGSDEVPDDALYQCHGYMMLTDFPRWHLGVAFGNQEFREYVINPDAELHEMIIDECDRFWNINVLGGIQPAVDGSESWARYLRKKHPGALFPHRDAIEEEIVRAEAARDLRKEIKKLEKKIAEHENNLKAAIGDAAGLVMPDGKRFNWSEQCGKTSWKAIAGEIADITGTPKEKIDELIEKYRGAPSRTFKYPRGW